jgi:hypothetical protein
MNIFEMVCSILSIWHLEISQIFCDDNIILRHMLGLAFRPLPLPHIYIYIWWLVSIWAAHKLCKINSAPLGVWGGDNLNIQFSIKECNMPFFRSAILTFVC